MATKKNATPGQTSLSVSAVTVEAPVEYLGTAVISLDKSAEAGQIVEVRAEPDNSVDPKALAMFVGEERVGYLGNKPATVRAGTKPGATLHKMVTNKKTAKTFAKLSDPETITSGNSTLTTFKASLYFVPMRKSAKKAAKPETYRAFSGAASCPGRDAMLKYMEDNKVQSIPVVFNSIAGTTIRVFPKDKMISTKVVAQVSVPGPDDSDKDESYKKLCSWVGNRSAQREGILHCIKDEEGTEPPKYEVEVDFSKDSDVSGLHAAIDRVISRCVEQANTLEAKAKLMRDAGIPSSMICQVFDGYQSYPPEFEAMIPAPEHPFVDDAGEDPVLMRAISYHLHGKHIRLVGEKGCGKNTLIETVDWLMRRPLFRVSGNSDLDKTDIIGSRTIMNGSMEYELTTFLRVLEAGGDVDMDECNAIKPDVELIIHSLTDQTRAINVPGYGEVKMGKNATFWATMNEDYIGTGDMNDATVDRFTTIRLKSPSDIKSVLKARVPTAADSDITLCQRVYADMRKAVGNGELSSTCISIRGFIDALECSDCLPLSLSLLDTVAAKPQDASERTALQTIIENLAG